MTRRWLGGTLAAILWASSLTLVAGSAAAAAQTGAEVDLKATAGLTAESPLYGVERALERLQVVATQNLEQKARLEARFALERAAEAAHLEGRGRHELALKAVADHAQSLAAAQGHLARAVESAGGAEVRAVAQVQAVHKQSVAVLARVLAGAPESARPALEAVLARQGQRLVEISARHEQNLHTAANAAVSVQAGLGRSRKR